MNGRSRGLISPIPLLCDPSIEAEIRITREQQTLDSMRRIHDEYDIKENCHVNLSEIFRINRPLETLKS